MADNVSVRKQRLQGLAKGKVGRYGGAALLCGTMGSEVDCRCCQEVPSAKSIQRDRERIDDVSSNMKTSESLLSAQWRRSRSGRSGGRRTNIFAKKKKKKTSVSLEDCLMLVVFARLVERGLFVMEDPEF